MNLTPPVITINYDMDTKTYIGQSVYDDKKGQELVVVCTGVDFVTCLAALNAHLQKKLEGKK